jgi:starch-binding outer membrane protein, SusD/RagB family
MKTKILFTAVLLLAGFQSCDKSLDETIYGKISESNYWNSEKDAVTAIKAAYTVIRGGWHGLSFWQFAIEDGGTDISTGGYFAMNDYIAYTGWSATTPDFNSWGLWTPFWSGVNYANAVLDYVPGMDIDQAVKDRVTGEGYAIRAMIYFHLVNWFGGMPEVTTTKEAPLSIPRQTPEHNYALIESDLVKAIDLLPLKSELVAAGEADYGRLTKGAAQALLAKVYLQQGKWTECAGVAQELINSGEYMLEPDYMDIFALENEGFKNKEEIWVLPFVTGTSPEIEANVLQVYLFKAPEITTYSKYYDWNGDIRVTSAFYNSFEAGDLRRKGLYYSASGGVADPVMLLKYPPDPATAGAHSGTDYPFIRYADVLLMHAEASANLDDLESAASDVNTVRRRAGLSEINSVDFDRQSLLSHIYNERRWELYFEGHARQDMIRMNYQGMIDYIKTKSTDWQQFGAERYLLLPIPANAVAANPGMIQNPGFE